MQSPLNIFGYTSTAGTSFVPIRGTNYTEQLVDAQRSLVSTSAADTSAGTGARVIRVTYFDQTMMGPFTEDVTLSGTTPSNTSNSNICFIESLVVMTAGSQLANAGTVSLKAAAGGGGVTVGSIAPGDNQTQWCHHYVGVNRASRIYNITGSIKGIANGEVHTRISTPTIANTTENNIAPVLRVSPGVQIDMDFPAPIVVFGPARILLYGKSQVAVAQDWQAAFTLYDT